MAVAVLVLNLIMPALGTIVFLCCFSPKERKDTVNALCHIGFTILSFIFLIVFIVEVTSSNGDSSSFVWIILFSLSITITLFWGIIFGAILLMKNRAHTLRFNLNQPVVTHIQYQ